MNTSLIKVLLVEDNEDDYVVTRELLADVSTPQFELEWVSTYETAVEVITRQQHDVYLLDYRLGIHTGLELLRHALEIGCDAPIILLTGSPSTTNVDLEAMELGAADFLSKNEISTKLLERSLRYAVRQRQLYQQVKHQAEREQAMNRVVQTIRNSLDLDTVFSTATFEIAQLLQSDLANILQYHPEQGLWRNVSAYRRHPELPDTRGLEISDLGDDMIARLKHLEVIRIEDASCSSDATCQSLAELFSGSWLLVPLTFGCQLWGSLCLVREGHLFSWHEWEVELARSIADQLAIAIQQSQLHQQVQQLNVDLEHQVQTRTAELQLTTAKLQLAFDFEATLKCITDKVRDSLDESQILQTAVEELAKVMGVLCCNASLYDLETETSTTAYEYITDTAPNRGQITQITDYPELYAQLYHGQSFQSCPLVPHPLRGQVATLACPIFDDQGVLGDLWLVQPSIHTFSIQETRLVQQVANQCAIALRQSQLYQAAQAQVEELERLHLLKDDFLSTVTHELRTPMASIKLAIQMLEVILQQTGLLDETTSQASRYFQILRNECKREIDLINDLLDLSRLDAEQNSLVLTTLALHHWLSEIVERFAERMGNQQQRLQLDISPELLAVTTDFTILERVLSELLHNACKYTPVGEQIRVAAQPMADILQIRISNSGTEIPANELPRLFDKFYRIPNRDPWKHGGTGLGLALVKQRTEQLQGTIQVTSEQGWMTFTLSLPWQIK